MNKLNEMFENMRKEEKHPLSSMRPLNSPLEGLRNTPIESGAALCIQKSHWQMLFSSFLSVLTHLLNKTQNSKVLNLFNDVNEYSFF
jgi:hypothetical protein